MELRVIAGLRPRNPAMTYMHALNPKITSGSVQNESYVVKPFWGPYRMKTVLAPPPPQAGRDGRKRKHGFGVELRVIAGLLYRSPALACIILMMCWSPQTEPNDFLGNQWVCVGSPTGRSWPVGEPAETRGGATIVGKRRASLQEPCDDL